MLPMSNILSMTQSRFTKSEHEIATEYSRNIFVHPRTVQQGYWRLNKVPGYVGKHEFADK